MNRTSDFYNRCKKYGQEHPATTPPKKKWYECLTDERKRKNEDIVTAMISYANGKPELFDYEYGCYPTFYYNGMRTYKSDTGSIICEKNERIVCGINPRILPVFIVNDDVAYRFDGLLKPLGYYVECWSYGYYIIADCKDNVSDKEYQKFKTDTSLDTEKYFGTFTKEEIPQILKDISKMWHDLSAKTGDSGGCVLGEGMQFTYCGQRYKMSPSSPWQGEGSWTPHIDYIKSCLDAIGALDIYFDYGHLD